MEEVAPALIQQHGVGLQRIAHRLAVASIILLEPDQLFEKRQAGQRRHFLIGQMPVERAVEVADRHRAVDDHRAILLLADVRAFGIMLIGDLADNFLEHVFERDQAHHLPILVHHQGKMGLAPEKGGELVGNPPGVGNEPGRLHDRLDRYLRRIAFHFDELGEQVLHMQDAATRNVTPSPVA